MNQLVSAMAFLLAQLLLATLAMANPIVSVVPHVAYVFGLQNFEMDIVVSGLRPGSQQTLLGGFDLSLDYDANRVQFLPFASSLGDALGDPNDPAQISVGSDNSVAGRFRFYEVSLLEATAAGCFYCTGPYLEDLQGDAFVLARLSFYSSGPSGPLLGDAGFSFSAVALADAQGNDIAGVTTRSASVAVLPEPAALWLTLAALCVAALARAGGRRARHARRAGVAALTLGAALATQAATFNVPTGDTAALVQAIAQANGLAGPSTIVLGGGTYEITAASETGLQTGGNGLPSIVGEIAIQGNGATIRRADAAPALRAFLITGTGRLTLSRTTIANFNSGTVPGSVDLLGALRNEGQLVLDGASVQDNLGRGLVNINSGRASLVNTNVLRNRQGGGVLNESGTLTISGGRISTNAGSDGAGILNRGIVVIENALIDGNAGRDGAGLANAGDATLTNSTLSGNRASGDGGGLWNLRRAALQNVTVANNTAGRFGGGVWNYRASFFDPATLRLDNALLAGNLGSLTVNLNLADDCSDNERRVSGSASLIQNGGCTAAALGFLTGDPSLGALGNNGGATPTHALLAGSRAIDAGSAAVCPAFDQRGVARPQDGDGDGTSACDIGAYEFVRSSADLNGDGCVDSADMATILAVIASPGFKDLKFDLNGDGKVNIADARKLATMFSKPGGQPCR